MKKQKAILWGQPDSIWPGIIGLVIIGLFIWVTFCHACDSYEDCMKSSDYTKRAQETKSMIQQSSMPFFNIDQNRAIAYKLDEISKKLGHEEETYFVWSKDKKNRPDETCPDEAEICCNEMYTGDTLAYSRWCEPNYHKFNTKNTKEYESAWKYAKSLDKKCATPTQK